MLSLAGTGEWKMLLTVARNKSTRKLSLIMKKVGIRKLENNIPIELVILVIYMKGSCGLVIQKGDKITLEMNI